MKKKKSLVGVKKPWENAKCGYCGGYGNIDIMTPIQKEPFWKKHSEPCPKCSPIKKKKRKVKKSMVGYVSEWITLWYDNYKNNDEIRCSTIFKHKGSWIKEGFRPIKIRITIQEI